MNETAENRKHVQAKRDGRVIELRNTEIMVGDLVQIEEGMQLPSDGIVVRSTELKCDESSMTGETDFVKKDPYHDCVKKRDEIL